MEIKGKVTAIMAERTGTSQRTGMQWKLQDYVIEFWENLSDMLPQQMVITLRGVKIDQMKLEVGDMVDLAYHHAVREYKDSAYNDIIVDSIRKEGHQDAPEISSEAPAPFPTA